ncbi:hypothetical protein N7491_005136 [Penicillium cf. griseofulvum]|uniref:Uncharacterized protein n=1 Tax=Penicillium cf. griseofulvum TaxID=2972120 RepID=A0A9W9M4E6_9EURO|nr:hypothetical protein N7472_007829 [Penicillium cf. griseofulvum]KAJ5434541.1 hypothetical protein N7491_005136 [Penicillium cf. griseofulvum]
MAPTPPLAIGIVHSMFDLQNSSSNFIIVTMSFIDDLRILSNGSKTILQVTPTDIMYIVFD